MKRERGRKIDIEREGGGGGGELVKSWASLTLVSKVKRRRKPLNSLDMRMCIT